MNFVIVMTAVQDPNMRRIQHCCCPVVTRAFIQGSLAVVLPIPRTQVVRTKIRRMASDVVPVFVVNDSRVVRGVGSIAPARRRDKCTMLQQFPAWPEVNLASHGNWILLRHSIPSARQAVMASLKRQPIDAASQSIAHAPLFRSGMVSGYDRRDPRQWGRTQFAE